MGYLDLDGFGAGVCGGGGARPRSGRTRPFGAAARRRRGPRPFIYGTAKTVDNVASGEESRSSQWKISANHPIVKKMRSREAMRNAYEAKLQRIRDGIQGLKDEADINKFEPRPFGDDLGAQKISASSDYKRSVVSIALFHDEVMVFACSGTVVRIRDGCFQGPHIVFVTSARLAHEFNANRTKDDKLRIEMRTADNTTMHGYMGLHDDNIAVVVSFSHRFLCTLDMCDPVDLPPGPGTRNNKLFAFGCAHNCTLMGISCSHPVFQKDGLVLVNCHGITETGLGGPVICFGHGGSGHFVGVVVGYCVGKTTFIPKKLIHEFLQGFWITSKTSHFRGYSLPNKGVKSVIPSGYMVRSKIHQSLGYPLPPPLVFELNGGLAGTFEAEFGQLHFWEGYPFDHSYIDCWKPIWEQLGKKVTEKMSKSVVSIASFKEDVRHFACTGLLITRRGSTFVLTSASLVRIGDAQDEIDENLTFQVFLPPGQCVDGRLELYHPNYNIAIVSLEKDLSDISPDDLLNVRAPCSNKVVAAIGRGNKERQGLLMASMGKVSTINRRAKKKERRGLNLNCKDLLSSTCKIEKVGIGGALIGLNGKFMGMNFYDESRTTPFLPSTKIVTVLERGFRLLSERDSIGRPVNMDRPTRKCKERNRWPVSKPYWYLGSR